MRPRDWRSACVAIVEDEALVAMVMCDMLTELGYSVVGPFSNTSDALAAIKAGRLDAAILDVNLGHEMAYDVTGYGTQDVESLFGGVRKGSPSRLAGNQ